MYGQEKYLLLQKKQKNKQQKKTNYFPKPFKVTCRVKTNLT